MKAFKDVCWRQVAEEIWMKVFVYVYGNFQIVLHVLQRRRKIVWMGKQISFVLPYFSEGSDFLEYKIVSLKVSVWKTTQFVKKCTEVACSLN